MHTDGATIYIAQIISGGNVLSVYKSTDSGSTWTKNSYALLVGNATAFHGVWGHSKVGSKHILLLSQQNGSHGTVFYETTDFASFRLLADISDGASAPTPNAAFAQGGVAIADNKYLFAKSGSSGMGKSITLLNSIYAGIPVEQTEGHTTKYMRVE